MLLKQILLPPGGLFTLAAVLFLAARMARIPARWPAVASVAVAWLVCTPLVGETALTWHQTYPPLSGGGLALGEGGPQAVVVLSSDLRARQAGPAQPTLDAASTTRSLYAAAIAATADLPILVTGGPSGRSGRKIAPEMARFIGRWSAAEVRWIEPRARNTWENARYAAAMLAEARISRAYLVTHAWHMPRAVHAFEAHGLAVRAAPTGFVARPGLRMTNLLPRPDGLRASYWALHELLGRLAYRWFRAPAERADPA